MTTTMEDNVYETPASLAQYLDLHYPSSLPHSPSNSKNISLPPHDNAPTHALRFPQRVAALLNDLVLREGKNTKSAIGNGSTMTKPIDDSKETSALDMGCAVGGSSFELARTFQHVDAFDYSAQFIKAAIHMKDVAIASSLLSSSTDNDGRKQIESLSFEIPIEGDIVEQMTVVHEPTTTSDVASRVNFFVGDACKLEQMMVQDGKKKVDDRHCPHLLRNGYDAILMSNLLCRLPDPFECLKALPSLVKPGAVILILTPYTWLTEFTPREKWLGGYYEDQTSGGDDDHDNGSNKRIKVSSRDTLRQVMEGMGFSKIHEEQMPMLIREHQRKYQYCISEATGWLKKQE